jgi:BlaI family penicillinase repressor
MRQTRTTRLPRLSSAELDVMKTLWRGEKLSAREIHERVRRKTGWAYSTTRTLVERMVRKGVVVKRGFHGIHLYEPAISRAQGVARLVRDFTEQVLELPNPPITTLFADSDALTRSEIQELRRLLSGHRKEE